MQEWNVQGGSRRSASSEQPFEDGQSVRSVLCLVEDGGLARMDFALGDPVELGGAQPVAQWIRTFRSNEAEREIEREAVQSVEDLFVQLAEEDAAGEREGSDEAARAEEVRAALRFLLALHLERKRVLRPVGRIAPDGSQLYRHPKRDAEYRIGPAGISPELFARIEEQLELVF